MFRRRTTTAPTDGTPTPEATDTEAGQTAAEKASGKGRPTPKRREAEAARKERVKAPRDRREAMRQQRAKARAQRVKVQEAMKTGDERYLPARDRGPVRRFVRDYVDGRRTPAEFLLPFFLLIFLIMMVPTRITQTIALALWLPAIVLVPIDLIFLGVRLRKELRTRFPDESHRGSVAYGVMRATQLRRLRLPKPQVKPGGQPVEPKK